LRANTERGLTVAPIASPSLVAMRAASRFITGNTPGSARSTAHAWVFGSAPYCAAAPENSLLLVSSCTCTSRPMTVSHSM